MEPFIGSLMVAGFNYAPKGFLLCNGQTLAISANQALFALLGTYYGGNGVSTFQLPNLQGRAALGMGQGYTLGQIGGEDFHSLILNEMPLHNHNWMASNNAANSVVPAGNILAQPGSPGLYTTAANTTMSPAEIQSSGNGQPHENRSPFLVLNWCIAIVGIFPSRN